MTFRQLSINSSLLGLLALLVVVHVRPTEAFGVRAGKQSCLCRQRMRVARQASADGADGDGDEDLAPQSQESTLDVIQKCMGISPPAIEPDGLIIRPSRPGLSGFAVDEELGFVAILTSSDPSKKQSTHVVVSPLDRTEVRSAEALCMVQMSGGMDLGTAILPPDCLAQLVVDELEDEEVTVNEIRAQVSLMEVRAVSNPDRGTPESSADSKGVSSRPASTAERDTKLLSDVPKFMTSIQNLPGLAGCCTEDKVLEALKLHAKDDGTLDREGFTAILDCLRRQTSASREKSKVQFELVVSLDDQTLRVIAPTAFQALGLAMRYDKKLQVDLDEYDMDSLEILSRFPKFRPIEELEEDARLMDRFIPSMFAKTTPPKADDRA
jgi:hypothetical protein